MLLYLLKIVWFLIPAGFANIFAGISGKIFPKFNIPLDLGKKFRNKRIFGDHKTIRGFLFGVTAGSILYFLQIHLSQKYIFIQKIEISGFSTNPILGFLLSFGALSGDAIKSFFKRQLNIQSGKSWLPFDQIDWIVGMLLASSSILKFDICFIFSAVLTGFLLHMLIKVIGYTLKLQEVKI